MAQIASFTSAGTPVGPRDTLAQLMAKKKMLAQQQGDILAPRQIESWTQGASQLAQTAVNALQQRGAASEESAGRAQMAAAMAGIDWTKGPSPEQLQTIAMLDPDAGQRVMEQSASRALEELRYQRETKRGDFEFQRTQADQIEDEKRAAAQRAAETAASQGYQTGERVAGQEFTTGRDVAAEQERVRTEGRALEAKQAEEKRQLEANLTEYQGKKDIDAKIASQQGGDLDAVQKLRKEYTAAPQYKRFDEIKAGYDRMRSGAEANSGAGDIAMVYGYMKMLDPGSVVREGEFATAEEVGGAAQRLLGIYNKLVDGQRLTPDQRAEFMRSAGGQYGVAANTLDAFNSQFAPNAMQFNVDPKYVVSPVPRYSEWKEPQAPGTDTSTTEGLPVPQTDAEFNALKPGDKYIDPDDKKVHIK